MIKNLRIKNLALLKIAAEGVKTLQEQIKHMTASHMSMRKGYLIQQILTPLKPHVSEKMTSHYTSVQSSLQIAFVGRAGNSMKTKLIKTEELDHTRTKVSLHNLSLAFTVGYKIIFPSRFCLSASLSTHSGLAPEV